ncbi:M15 family metallopeptidase [Arcobacter vandammei]|uniref:M15 family metallopeptidase n=1 Tax=Arcobacter vandammei TaxID=2782243 RepID=UPI0018DF99DF|nr:M15 family metallopeptidase [Arcobacter vandammei]
MLSRFIFLLFFSLNLFASEDLAKRLILAYPDFLEKYEDNFIFFKDGSKLLFSDDKTYSNYEDRLNNSSLKEQMSMKYVKVEDDINFIPTQNDDAGRFRNEEFFKKMYGQNKKEIEKNLVKIKWLEKSENKTILVTKINNIDKKLANISKELDVLPKEYKKYLTNIAGTYKYRTISKTKRLSSHSFGISIDLNTKYSNYWLWEKKSDKIASYKNQIPKEIVKIFEKYGFIWGGNWYHYDTMHFEYRPELLN